MNLKYTTLRRDDHLIKMVNGVAVDLPSPLNISYTWNFGSLLMLFLLSQMVSGVLLSTNYVSEMNTAFFAVDMMSRDMWLGWLTRYLHMCGASFIFLFLYLHIGRGIYYHSFLFMKTWLSGVTIFLLSMISGFLGYVLPWGQMSYWGATVMTKFFSVVPYFGPNLVMWIWGSFSVDYPTLSRFFSLHFLFPFILLVFVGVHIMFLHETGSNNPLGVNSNGDKVKFFPYFLSKDFLGFFMLPGLLVSVFFAFPWVFMEYQNFIQANSLVTPPHIQPEWYFLSAYAVLRAMPSKLGGVLALVLFVAMLYFLPVLSYHQKVKFTPMKQIMFWIWVVNFLMLTWVGACPVEEPFISLSRIGCCLYFSFYFIYHVGGKS